MRTGGGHSSHQARPQGGVRHVCEAVEPGAGDGRCRRAGAPGSSAVLDRATERLAHPREPPRPRPQQAPACHRECPAPPATPGPQPLGQAAALDTLRPRARRPAREPVAVVERRAAHRQARDGAALASPRVPAVLEAEIAHDSARTQAASGDHRPDQGDGRRQPALGCRSHPGGVAEAGHQGRQTNDPTVHAARSSATPARPDLDDVRPQPCHGHLGRRLPASPRPVLPAVVRLRPHRAGLAAHRARRRHALTDRRLGRPAAAGSDALRRSAGIPHPR
jgi:hypothetical protein